MAVTATETIRVLALHGSEGNANDFTDRMEPLKSSLAKQGVDLVVTAIDAPFSKGSGLAWWTMPPGVRSFNAETYGGFEESATLVLDSLNNPEQQLKYDLILGHSQGAILLAAIVALGSPPYHPSKGYVLNGAAYPNPFMEQLKSLKIKSDERTPPPRVLCIIGQNDQITDASIQTQLRNCLQNAGLDVSTIEHPGGHSFPTRDDDTMAAVTSWFSQSV